MAIDVEARVTVITRAADPTQHLLEEDYTEEFQLSSNDGSYSTDTAAFATTVYNYYNSEASVIGTSNLGASGYPVANVELRWRVWVGGSSISGGTTTNEGVLSPPSNATDVQNELNKHIAYALTGDVVAPGS